MDDPLTDRACKWAQRFRRAQDHRAVGALLDFHSRRCKTGTRDRTGHVVADYMLHVPLRGIPARITIRPMFKTTQICLSLTLVVTTATAGLAQGAKTRFHLEEATIAGIQDAIKGGQITTLSLVDLYLKRIKA